MTTLRERLLRGTAAEFGIAAPPPVWAVVMDIGTPKRTVAILELADGSASLYTTTGGGIVGQIGHEAVRTAAIRLCTMAERYLQTTVPATSIEYPATGETRFYLVTSTGVRTATAPEKELGRRRHAMSPLFYAALDVLTQLFKNRSVPEYIQGVEAGERR